MLNEDTDIHGILVQLPLPKQIDERSVIDAIAVEKDVDGFHAINAGRLSIGGDMLKKAFIPCTPLGSLLLLKDNVDDLSGKNAVVVGRSNIVGKPMSQLLIEESCTVTVVHSKTKKCRSDLFTSRCCGRCCRKTRDGQRRLVKRGGSCD